MRRFRFVIEPGYSLRSGDVAHVADDADPLAGIIESAIDNLGTEVLLKIGDVTMHLAAWQDPEHWADDWREHAGGEDPVEFVAALVASAEVSD